MGIEDDFHEMGETFESILTVLQNLTRAVDEVSTNLERTNEILDKTYLRSI